MQALAAAVDVAPTIRDQQRLVDELATEATIGARPDLAPIVHWAGAASEPIHRWFRYREAFAPGLIEGLGLRPPFLDPFCGCGSIMVGAAQRGARAVGIDLNPLATFAARVKLRPLGAKELRAMSGFLATTERRTRERWPVPALSIAGRVFEPRIQDELLRIRALIATEPMTEAARDALLLAWLSILEPCGSFFKEGNGLKYRRRKRTPDGYVLRTDGAWQDERFGADQRAFVRRAFRDAVELMQADAAHWTGDAWGDQTVLDGSALELSDLTAGQRFASIVFSPPYANRFDYFESMKVELWFGGFVDSYDELRGLRKRSLRSHLAADLGRPTTLRPELEELLELMDADASSVRMGIRNALRGYFDDMAEVLRQCRAVLDGRGECHVVVGNSAYAGVIVPTDLLLARIGREAGFSRARLDRVRHLTVAPQQRGRLGPLADLMRESVVTFS